MYPTALISTLRMRGRIPSAIADITTMTPCSFIGCRRGTMTPRSAALSPPTAVFIGIGVIDFIEDPSWSKAGWLLLDIGLAILPCIPAISSVRHLGKIDDAVDLTRTYGHIDNFADAGGVIRRAKKADFLDDGWDLVRGINRTDDGFTISNKLLGTTIHTKFMGGGRVINKFKKVFIKVIFINKINFIIM